MGHPRKPGLNGPAASGAEALLILMDLTARVNSCPSQERLETEFFSSLLAMELLQLLAIELPTQAKGRLECATHFLRLPPSFRHSPD